jgi:hypothetical protein
MPTFKPPSFKKPSFVVSRLVHNMRTKKYYSLIAERFYMAAAALNNPVDLESQNLSLMTLLIFLIKGLFNKLCTYLLIFLSKFSTSARFHVRLWD